MYITGDLHGSADAYCVSKSKFDPKSGGIVLCCGDLGGVWHHDYHTNRKHQRQEDFFLESTLRQRFLWLAVDGNHENFDRLLGGEFQLVELFGGKAYKIRDHVYYLKRCEIFEIEGKTFLAFGGAMSHDREKCSYIDSCGRKKSWPGRTEKVDWWPEEVPSQDDFDNACRNLDRVNWKVDHVISHTCPESQRSWFISDNRPPDPTEEMLEQIYRKLEFKSWHFGHFHCEKQADRFFCHYGQVMELRTLVDA